MSPRPANPQTSRSVIIQTRVTKQMARFIEVQAAEQGMTISEFLRSCVREHFERRS